MNELAEWDSFYLIVGGAAGALIGLQFVAMTLIASRPNAASSADAGAAFATPTIVHFVEAFLIAAFVRMPWRNESSAAAMCGVVGVIGAVYTVIVARRMVIQTSYEPVFEDWLFHAILPLIAYVIIVISAIEVSSYERGALFGVGAATLCFSSSASTTRGTPSRGTFLRKPGNRTDRPNVKKLMTANPNKRKLALCPPPKSRRRRSRPANGHL